MTLDTESNWYQDFFTELPNAFWRAAVPPEATEAEVAFIVERAGLRPGSVVLDAPCGSGRHTLALARRGCQVTGVDVSAEAIAFASAAADRERLDVRLRVGDMRDLPREIVADAVLCLGNSFGYLEHAATVRYLDDVANIVSPGGTLIIDSGFIAESLLHGLTLDEPPMTIGGVEAISVNHYDVSHSRWITEFTFRRGTEEHCGTSIQHVYTSAEVVRLVTAAGFTSVRLYGGLDGAPYELGSPRMLLVARR